MSRVMRQLLSELSFFLLLLAFAVLSGAYTMDGMGLEGARAHTRREYVTDESIERRYAFSVKAIEKCMREFDHL